MFRSNFSLAIFSLMFFPLFSTFFADNLKIYEPPKIYNKILRYLIILSNTCLNNNYVVVHLYVPISSGF